MQVNIEVFCTVILSFWGSVTRHAQSNQNKFVYLCNISIKAYGMKLSFCLQINTKVFDIMIVSLCVYLTRQVQSKKTTSLQYLCDISRKPWRMKLIFCLLILLGLVFSNWIYHFRCMWPGMPRLPKITSLLFLYNMLRKKWVMQLIFYMQISMKACSKLILRFLMVLVKHCQSSQNSKFAMSLQYL